MRWTRPRCSSRCRGTTPGTGPGTTPPRRGGPGRQCDPAAGVRFASAPHSPAHPSHTQAPRTHTLHRAPAKLNAMSICSVWFPLPPPFGVLSLSELLYWHRFFQCFPEYPKPHVISRRSGKRYRTETVSFPPSPQRCPERQERHPALTLEGPARYASHEGGSWEVCHLFSSNSPPSSSLVCSFLLLTASCLWLI